MRKLLALPCVLALSACGFHPLYGPQHGQSATVAARLDEVDIGLIPDRQGQLLREALESDLQRAGAPSYYRYHLAVSYSINVQIIGIQQDSSNTRNRYLATAQWTLTPEGNRTIPVAKGTASAMDAENVIDNQYFQATLDNGVMRHQLAREIAHQITAQLAIYLRAHPAAGS
ncbi:MAG: LPS assembly lipoprotein LptE [Acidiphilium sp.]|uniref:LPS assembly lipoprotein LptE n=1 Tax=Acidiphilium acidophilum TaxID=76588 RepID=A0AAW9DMT8_ACIAO|nr:LPS assembly lipoprotein LptE [Acidiphilium acidophilum]MDD2860499.1 LPS assembly lipoprotein LptE [Acidiphilium sp.]MDX5930045.1 LPS assembly lipoprotein LptE [Acidiphilium acidophilum]MEE3503319.1 LPS assembly lipoprotein LptE [Acidiphilium acidophilum]GBQ10593.1 hypothetical protein AA700_1005 [Acidiphilium acidophilum DSM 700]